MTVTVVDDEGAETSDTLTVTVNNLAPALSVNLPTQVAQYSDPISPIVFDAIDVPTDTVSANVSYSDDNGVTFVSGLPGGLALTEVLGVGTGTWTVTGIADTAPDVYSIRLEVSDEDGGVSALESELDVHQEDARVTYTGPFLISTPSIKTGETVVELRATVRDFAAVDPSSDAHPGDIRNATVTFIDRDRAEIIATNLPIDLLDPADLTTGIASFPWAVDIGNADAETFNIGIRVDSFYVRDSSDDDVLLTVAKPLDDFITGGGFIQNENSFGALAGDDGLNTNFGFNVKFNPRLTNLQGNANFVIRHEGEIVRIKTNAIESLVVDEETGAATFVSKANIVGDSGGNLSLIVTITDRGEPGDEDAIGITLWNKNELLFSSNWDGAQTIEQQLSGGNLATHQRGKNLLAASGSVTPDSETAPLTRSPARNNRCPGDFAVGRFRGGPIPVRWRRVPYRRPR